MSWQRSSYCGGGTCVEVRHTGDDVEVRDSKNPGHVLTFTTAEWHAFTKGVKAGEFDDG